MFVEVFWISGVNNFDLLKWNVKHVFAKSWSLLNSHLSPSYGKYLYLTLFMRILAIVIQQDENKEFWIVSLTNEFNQ